MPIVIDIIKGPDRDKKITMDEQSVIIGRDRSAGVALSDQAVSRQHCKLIVEDGVLAVEDLKSTNKTYLNDEPVGNPQPVTPQDLIRVGETVMRARLEDIPEKEETVPRNRPKTSARTLLIDSSNVMVEKISNNLDLMYRVNSAIHSIRDSKKLITRLLELIVEVIPADHGAILLYDQKTSRLKPEVSYCSERGVTDEICISRTIANQVFEKKIAVVTRDAQQDPRFMDKKTIIQHNIRSAMCVPMGTVNRMIGVIHMDNTIKSGLFTEKDLDLLSAIANQAAIALENIQFFERLNEENKVLKEAIKEEYDMIGQSNQMHKVFSLIDRLSRTDSTILIRGESGTGKELVARAIHYNSDRKDKPFVCVNCAALHENLLESELFGHERGAFTGATMLKKGRFELADGGTIFLDEIGEMNLESQIKLLRILEEAKLERVGGTASIPTNVRILAATNRDLEKAIQDGEFRLDLYYRLKVIQIDLPPLRDRKDDIVPLALFFLDKYRAKISREVLQFSPEALDVLKAYHWPGNIREMKNCIERAVVLGNSNVILPEDLPLEIRRPVAVDDGANFPTLQDLEREHIIKALNLTGWNKKQTADILGIQRSTLYEKLKGYHIAL
ncbi:MAG: sigma 54-interacting transcriptional regulator [Candidatus Auribacterota bacterium]|jgi:Nif-specific regulatory protein|nr:sigma 54-interacting transcriptional regulator [Candidatus Auribacterota bacterium]